MVRWEKRVLPHIAPSITSTEAPEAKLRSRGVSAVIVCAEA